MQIRLVRNSPTSRILRKLPIPIRRRMRFILRHLYSLRNRISASFRQWTKALQKPEALYASIMLIIIVGFLIYFDLFGSFSTAEEDARNLLATTIQSLAGAIAIVVSLSLIAVQLASQTYGSRILDLYIRQKLFWIIFGQFILSIFYNVAALSILSGNMSSMAALVSFSLFLTFASFSALIPLILKTTEMLKPDKLIQIISREIDRDYVDSLDSRTYLRLRDPISSLSEIAMAALKQDDLQTLMLIERSLLTRFLECVDNSNEENSSLAYCRFFNHIITLGIQSHKESPLSVVSGFLERTILETGKKHCKRAKRNFTDVLFGLAEQAVAERLKVVALEANSSIVRIVHKELEQVPHEDKMRFFDIVKSKETPKEEIEEKTKNDLEFMDFSFRWFFFLRKFGLVAAERDEELTSRVVMDLTGLIVQVFKMQKGAFVRRSLLTDLMLTLSEICKESSKNGFREPLSSLLVLTSIVDDRMKAGDIEGTRFIINYVSAINLHAVEVGICDWGIINELGAMGRVLTRTLPQCEDEIVFLTDVLGKIGEAIRKEKKTAKGYMVSEELKTNLKFVIEAISSIRKWDNHSNQKVISAADRWLKKFKGSA
jgi:hypothetical protein